MFGQALQMNASGRPAFLTSSRWTRQLARMQASPSQQSSSDARDVKARSATLVATTVVEDVKALEYNKTMNTQMEWGLNPYEYHPQRGLYWHEIVPGLICGTQPRSADDVTALQQQGVTHIVNLQTDTDLQYWSVNIDEIKRRAAHLGVAHFRKSARDFDPASLRKTLPSAVSTVHHALAQRGRVYVHCTAGLGRAPAVCIAYMYWFMNMDLDHAYKTLTDIRPCGPKRDAIRGATHDLLSGAPSDQFERLDQGAWATLSEEDRYALQWRVLKAGK